MGFNFNKFEFPLPNGALVNIWLISAQSFWRRGRYCEKFTDRQLR